MEDFTDVVDQSLYGLDPPKGSSGSLSIGSGAEGFWPPGPEGTSGCSNPMVCWMSRPEVGSRIYDPEASWFLGPEGASRSWDLTWGSGLRVGSRSWVSEASLSCGPSAGSESCDPDPAAGAPFNT
jgi:hypothetical protein